MATLHEVLKNSQDSLHQRIGYSLDEAKLEARFILEHALKITQKDIIAKKDQVIDLKDQNFISFLTTKRISGMPLPYILGEWSFYGRSFKVNPNVLIPRADTEIMIENVLHKINTSDCFDILDLGCGTGIIGITLALERPHANVTLMDQSEDALKNAKDNKALHQVFNVSIQKSDWFSACNEVQFDLIISNPPYLEARDKHLLDGLQYEPKEALVSGPTGLEAIQHIIISSKNYIKPYGWLFVEHGNNQSDILKKLFRENHFQHIEQAKDIHGVVRVTFGQYSIV